MREPVLDGRGTSTPAVVPGPAPDRLSSVPDATLLACALILFTERFRVELPGLPERILDLARRLNVADYLDYKIGHWSNEPELHHEPLPLSECRITRRERHLLGLALGYPLSGPRKAMPIAPAAEVIALAIKLGVLNIALADMTDVPAGASVRTSDLLAEGGSS